MLLLGGVLLLLLLHLATSHTGTSNLCAAHGGGYMPSALVSWGNVKKIPRPLGDWAIGLLPPPNRPSPWSRDPRRIPAGRPVLLGKKINYPLWMPIQLYSKNPNKPTNLKNLNNLIIQDKTLKSAVWDGTYTNFWQ